LLPAPVPGTPVSGDPVTPGPPDVPVLGAAFDVPDELVPELAPPGIAPTPGAPDVAVPTEPEPDVEGRSAPLVTERSALLAALALDLDEVPPEVDGVVVSDDEAPCAWALTPLPSAAAHATASMARSRNGFMRSSTIQKRNSISAER
jgi:hypothetical protein